ncbi:MAG: hypothetical protein AB1781_11155 [Pseudomonadota bacterium]
MTDIVERLERHADLHGAPDGALMREAAAEIVRLRFCVLGEREEVERLRAGGCARDQRLTQYCAELRAAVVAEREACARIADDLHGVVSLDTYAVDQPLSSTGERFACREIAAAIRARTVAEKPLT